MQRVVQYGSSNSGQYEEKKSLYDGIISNYVYILGFKTTNNSSSSK